MFYVYILYSKSHDEIYIGYSNNLKRRLDEHNSGKVPSTKNKKPWKLVYYESYLSDTDAKNRESALKLRGQARFHLLTRLENSLKETKKLPH
jgi:putative endonuclease